MRIGHRVQCGARRTGSGRGPTTLAATPAVLTVLDDVRLDSTGLDDEGCERLR
jgi:hypothetical protein